MNSYRLRRARGDSWTRLEAGDFPVHPMESGLNVKILLVEDNEDIREGLTDLLQSEGYSVSSSGSAEEGLDLLRAELFHLVITDYMLPGQNGGWLLEQAEREHRLRDTGTLMITAHPRVRPPTGVRLMHKPLDIDDFLRVVCESLPQLRAVGG